MFTLEELCIEITGKCLMHCRHCSSSCTESNLSSLSYDCILRIFDEARLLGTKTIEISGGEPLLHPRILDIIREAKKYFEVRLYTSGFLGDCEGIPTLLISSMASLGLDRIIFNLQGASAEIHEQITMTPGSFECVIASIRQAKAAGLWTGVHFVPMLPNVKEIGALAELCRAFRVDELAILRFVNQGRGSINSGELELANGDFQALVMDIVREKRMSDSLYLRTGCPMNFCSFVDSDIRPVKCKAGLSTLLINFDGRVVPCPAFKQEQAFTIGNITQSSLTDLWHHSDRLRQLRTFDFRRIRVCNECNRLDVCQGRCMAQRFYATGSIYEGPDPLCPYKQDKSLSKKKEIGSSVLEFSGRK
ncbi:MAG: radical SAM protein [Thermodesulfovibrionales bacterium]|jgi:radical SAM protein with 4Fe4S-binding SPASM domain